MAFFSDGWNEYFSLCLNPVLSERAHIYRLSERQQRVSEIGIPVMLVASALIMGAILTICLMESFGFLNLYITNDAQEILVVTTAGASIVITSVQFIGFLALRRNRIRPDDKIIVQKSLGRDQLIPTKSVKACILFFVNLLVPFVALAALPGGLPGFFAEIPRYGFGYKLFLANIFLMLFISILILVRRISFLLKFTK